MVDDGRASCVFVSKDGCSVYENRPAACRAYPMGRAVVQGQDGILEEHFILLKEKHCKGFYQPVNQDPELYTQDQGLLRYNKFNDALSVILQHESLRKDFQPNKDQIARFTLALYNIDTFKEKILAGEFPDANLSGEEKETLGNDENLLLYGINWLQKQLFTDK